MNETNIEWTDFTSNPLRYRDADGKPVWACVKTSPGCLNCYAEKMSLSTRFDSPGRGKGKAFTTENMRGLTPYMDGKELGSLLTSSRIDGQRLFVCDMTDLFGDWVPDELIDRLFAVMALRGDVQFQVLTKRAERMRDYCAAATPARFSNHITDAQYRIVCERVQYPLKNVWLGVSCENREQLKRLDVLKATPAAIRFVSFEPLLEDLGAFDLRDYQRPANDDSHDIHWAIIGGESGPGKRPIDANWMRSIRDEAQAAGIACFCKQMDKVQPLPLDLMACREFPA